MSKPTKNTKFLVCRYVRNLSPVFRCLCRWRCTHSTTTRNESKEVRIWFIRVRARLSKQNDGQKKLRQKWSRRQHTAIQNTQNFFFSARFVQESVENCRSIEFDAMFDQTMERIPKKNTEFKVIAESVRCVNEPNEKKRPNKKNKVEKKLVKSSLVERRNKIKTNARRHNLLYFLWQFYFHCPRNIFRHFWRVSCFAEPFPRRFYFSSCFVLASTPINTIIFMPANIRFTIMTVVVRPVKIQPKRFNFGTWKSFCLLFCFTISRKNDDRFKIFRFRSLAFVTEPPQNGIQNAIIISTTSFSITFNVLLMAETINWRNKKKMVNKSLVEFRLRLSAVKRVEKC